MSHLYIAATVGLVGCGRFAGYPSADLTDPEVVSRLEAQVRPERIHGWLIPFPEEGSCGTRTSGDRTVAEGPCEIDSDDDGFWDEAWDGRAVRTVDRDVVGGVVDRTRISYDNFVARLALDCPGANDMFTLTLTNGTSTEWSDGRFEIDVGGAASWVCSDPDNEVQPFDYTFDVSYDGEVHDGNEGEEWDGAGRYADSEVGLVDAVTREYRDPYLFFGCSPEPEAGRTTLSTPDHEAVLDFDAATDCDGFVSWALDGVDQATFEATATCSTGPVDPNAFPLLVIGLLVRGRLASDRARTPGS